MKTLTHSPRPKMLQRLLGAAALCLALSHCAAPPTAPEAPPGKVAPAATPAQIEEMAARGQFVDAALLYAQMADTVGPPLRQEFQVRAAELLAQGNYTVQATQILIDMDSAGLSTPLALRKTLLETQISLEKQPAVILLGKLDDVAGAAREAPEQQRRQYHQLRAQVYGAMGNHLESARERVTLDALIGDPQQRAQNQAAILETLQQLSDQALTQLRTKDAPDVMSGWMELAFLAKPSRERAELRTNLDVWRNRYRGHPASESLLENLAAGRAEAVPLPNQVALILPLEGRLAGIAAAIRDGFLAAYYADADNPGRPLLRTYNEPETPDQVTAVYQQAVSDGAQLIIGPLDKPAVNQLLKQADIPVPTIALNHADDAQAMQPLLFQMSLSPDEEAQQVAERAWLDGHRRAVILAPSSAWGERVNQAFQQRWLALGGTVVSTGLYDPKQNDYSAPIRHLFNVDASDARRQSLKSVLATDLEFTPRRRQDMDFIFMAAYARQARLLRPQIRFHHASAVPVYGTSHVYEGMPQPDKDRDMDGLRFVDTPWTLELAPPDGAIKAAVTALWPEPMQRNARLYALGIDAYHLMSKLERLRRERFESYAGKTGQLLLDATNRFQRRLQWAQFVNGTATPLDTF